jgi:catechol 2,3-dioxygenase-like lactoylglutathione lyase family enzyme
MTVELNHTIVPARDKGRSAEFLAAVLGLEVGRPWGPFAPVVVGNGVTLDFVDAGDFEEHHYAFLVGDDDFGPILERIRARGVGWYADPGRRQAGAVNRHYGGRGVYFDDPDHHLMEVLTRPYGSAPEG